MRTKETGRNYVLLVVSCGCFLVAVVFGIIFRIIVPDCGVAQLHTIKDAYSRDIYLNYAWGEVDEADIIATKTSDNIGVDDIALADVIAIVSPTGKIEQTEGSLGQEVTINRAVKGEVTVGQKIYIYQYFGFRAVDGHIEYMNTLNVMNPSKEYIIFVDASPLNEYQQKPVFILKSKYLGYIRTDYHLTQTLGADYHTINFSTLSDYEFFSVSEKITEALNTARHTALDKFY